MLESAAPSHRRVGRWPTSSSAALSPCAAAIGCRTAHSRGGAADRPSGRGTAVPEPADGSTGTLTFIFRAFTDSAREASTTRRGRGASPPVVNVDLNRRCVGERHERVAIEQLEPNEDAEAVSRPGTKTWSIHWSLGVSGRKEGGGRGCGDRWMRGRALDEVGFSVGVCSGVRARRAGAIRVGAIPQCRRPRTRTAPPLGVSTIHQPGPHQI
jgi:hypothetical protein